MSIVSAIVLYAVLWFLVMFVLLPVRLETQGERGDIEPGTPSGAPADFDLRRKVRLVSLVTAGLWLVIAAVAWSGVVSVEDLDVFGRPSAPADGTGG